MKSDYIAHARTADGQKQSVQTHLTETATIAATLAKKLGLELAGELLGLLHDFGKYSQSFQFNTGETDLFLFYCGDTNV